MPTDLDPPLALQEFAHADANAVEYVLHERTGRIYIQPSGAACKVSTDTSQNEGFPIVLNFVPVADGGLLSLVFRRADEPGRKPGNRVWIASDAAADVRILSDRGN